MRTAIIHYNLFLLCLNRLHSMMFITINSNYLNKCMSDYNMIVNELYSEKVDSKFEKFCKSNKFISRKVAGSSSIMVAIGLEDYWEYTEYIKIIGFSSNNGICIRQYCDDNLYCFFVVLRRLYDRRQVVGYSAKLILAIKQKGSELNFRTEPFTTLDIDLGSPESKNAILHGKELVYGLQKFINEAPQYLMNNYNIRFYNESECKEIIKKLK